MGTAHVGRCRCPDTSKMRATVTATVEYADATAILICHFADAQTLVQSLLPDQPNEKKY